VLSTDFYQLLHLGPFDDDSNVEMYGDTTYDVMFGNIIDALV
jgi:hypothetical protein